MALKKQTGFLFSVIACAVLGVYAFAGAQTDFNESFTKSVSIGATDENSYVFAERILVNEPSRGDIYAVSTTLHTNSKVLGDIGFLGETLFVAEEVNGDVRAIAGDAFINGRIEGELIFLGDSLLVEEDAFVGKKTRSFVSDSTVVKGTVNDNLHVTGKKLVIEGAVNGTVRAEGVKHISIGPEAVIVGDVVYTDYDKDTLTVADGAVIGGETTTVPAEDDSLWDEIIYSLIFFIATGFFMYGIFMRKWDEVVRAQPKQWALNALVGIATLGGLCVVALVLLLLPELLIISGALFVLFLLLVFLGIMSVPVIVGALLYRLYDKEAAVGWQAVVLGILVLFILDLVVGGLVPIVSLLTMFIFTGWFVCFVYKALFR